MPWGGLLALGLLLIGGFLYWQLIIAEGAYLGRRVVTLLYDRFAHSYDKIKGFEPGYEQWFLGLPLSRALAALPDPLVLDVAMGTGRLARTLFSQDGFHGRMIGVDLSYPMLERAAETTQPWAARITLLWDDASHLCFPEATFDAVVCLEALEFMPDPLAVLREIVQVLRPGGLLLISNRIGSGARFLPGRTFSPEAFEAQLRELSLEMVRTQPWQEDYDLVWARKAGLMRPVGMRRLEEILRCPQCSQPLKQVDATFTCPEGHMHPVLPNGVIKLV